MSKSFVITCVVLHFRSNSANKRHCCILEDLNVIYLKTWDSEYHWVVYRQMLRYLLQNDKTLTDEKEFEWTIVGNEQLYIVVENLRNYLQDISASNKLILGSVVNRRFSFITFCGFRLFYCLMPNNQSEYW